MVAIFSAEKGGLVPAWAGLADTLALPAKTVVPIQPVYTMVGVELLQDVDVVVVIG